MKLLIIAAQLTAFIGLLQNPASAWDQWGYIDRNGHVAIKAQYHSAGSFDGGYAVVEPYSLRKYALPYPETVLINRRNEQFGESRTNAPFGMLRIEKNGSFGFKSLSGKPDIPPQFKFASDFKGGVAVVESRDSRWHVVDHNGQILRDLPSDWRLFSQEPLCFSSRDGFRHDFTGQHGSGDDVTGFRALAGSAGSFKKYIVRNYFAEGLAAAVDAQGKCCYLDKHGNKVITLPDSCIEAQDFSDGLAAVVFGNATAPKFGFINRAGDLVIEAKFPFVNHLKTAFVDGLALATAKRDEQIVYGYINKRGDFVIPPNYLQAKTFSEGVAAVDMSSLTFDSAEWKFQRKNNPHRSPSIFEQFLNQCHPIGLEASKLHELLGDPDSSRIDEKHEQTVETYLTSENTSVDFVLQQGRVLRYQRSRGDSAAVRADEPAKNTDNR